MNDSIKALRQAFRDKEYRHGYADEFLNAYIATQIKVVREQHEWSQAKLAEEAGMLQPRISVMENVNYASWSIKILRKIAEAFDLTLCVSFESFGKRIRDIETFARNNLQRDFFDNDPYFKEALVEASLDDETEIEKNLPQEQALGLGGGNITPSMLPLNPSEMAKALAQETPKPAFGRDNMMVRAR